MKTDERYYCYWIEIGRLDFDSAIDYARQLDDQELELYAWTAKRIALQNDTKLSGSAKQAAIEEANNAIDKLQKTYEDGLGLLGKTGSGAQTKSKDATDQVTGAQ